LVSAHALNIGLKVVFPDRRQGRLLAQSDRGQISPSAWTGHMPLARRWL